MTSGNSISTLEIRQERTSRVFFLRVEWTSVLKLVFTKLLQSVEKSNGKQMSQRPYLEETTDFSIASVRLLMNNHKARRFKLHTFLTINYSDVSYSNVQ